MHNIRCTILGKGIHVTKTNTLERRQPPIAPQCVVSIYLVVLGKSVWNEKHNEADKIKFAHVVYFSLVFCWLIKFQGFVKKKNESKSWGEEESDVPTAKWVRTLCLLCIEIRSTLLRIIIREKRRNVECQSFDRHGQCSLHMATDVVS